MNTAELKIWLREQQPILDRAIANAGRDFHELHKNNNFGYGLAECQKESFNLFDGMDLCYDRRETPLVYSLWYHGRRVNTFLTHFSETILTSNEDSLEVFDLGAGTGAIQWALGLIYHRMKEKGLKPPHIKIINVDTSPFMLYYGKDFLWKHFLTAYPAAGELEIQYEINSWSNETAGYISNPWIVASYLFDMSDTLEQGVNLDYREAIKTSFQKLITSFDPSRIFLLTSFQEGKKKLLQELQTDFARDGYILQDVADSSLTLSGPLPETNLFRKQLHELYLSEMMKLEPRYAESLLKTTSWSEGQFIARVLSKRQTELKLTTKVIEKPKITLHTERIKVRRNVDLNDDQLKAAQHSDAPTIIMGPAGCGKSIVLTERISNLVRENGFSEDLRILLTTFNKDLLADLGNWTEDLFQKWGPGKVRRAGSQFYFGNSNQPNLRLLHFDILPQRLGNGINLLPIGDNYYHTNLIKECIQEIKRERNITTNIYDGVLNPAFITDEYQRVIYGQQYSIKNEYMVAPRQGRRRLAANGPRRDLLWEVIVEKYLKRMTQETFTSKRHRLLQQLKRKEVTEKFTHIFVDEFQDCTQADYEIFYQLLNDVNKFVIAGDVAQAIQLGGVAGVPRADEGMAAKRSVHRLKGSYRVPVRISECICEIARSIENGNVISPYKGSPPGARPIVVYGETMAEAAEKIGAIFSTYYGYDIDKLSTLEIDPELSEALEQLKLPQTPNKILKIKGTERSCILWSSRKDIAYIEEVEEFVHTTFTRTTSILIIALFPDTLSRYFGILSVLRRDRLIFWDRISKEKFELFANTPTQNDLTEED